ncbi:MAG: EAL domain-containing protein [Sphaerochaetaceae bacterium]
MSNLLTERQALANSNTNRLYTRLELEHRILSDSGNRALVLVNLSTIHFLTLTYGFSYGQHVLHQVIITLQSLCNEQIIATRTFEGHLVFYVQGKNHTDILKTFCETLYSHLHRLLSKEGVGWGIGVMEFREHQEPDIDKAFRNVLIASESALDLESRCCFFTKKMQRQATKEEAIVNDLSMIVNEQKSENIRLQYQPIMDLKTNTICELEVLCRIESKTLGILQPIEFIHLAEKTKYIVPLGIMTFQKAFQFFQTLKKQGLDHIRLSINVSVIQLIDTDFLSTLITLLEEYAVDPSLITLEITESCIIANYQAINSLFSDIQAQGIQLALDDFGTGYSSLAHERTLHLNTLKIDKVFIADLLTIPEEKTITRDIIAMGHRLGHTIIAEGVEKEEQREYLFRHGCDKIQGYLISKPLYEDAIVRFLKARI